jgi:predicted Zn-dependent protease
MNNVESILDFSTFEIYSRKIFSQILKDESLTMTLSSEKTLFARLTKAKVRQITNLKQAFIDYSFIKGNKTLSFTLPFVGSDDDFIVADKKIKQSREWITCLPDDPYLVHPAFYGVTKDESLFELPTNESMLQDILENAAHLDLAGVFSCGDIVRATINSLGQFHWFKTRNFYFDYSIYNEKQKAVKSLLAGLEWDPLALKENLKESELKLNLMNRESKKIERGSYRVYLAPSAVSELLGTLSWGGVSMGDHQRGNGSLKDLWEKKKKLSSKFNLVEDFSLGLSPRFNDRGEVAPGVLELINSGELKNFLTSTRTSNEYKVETNFATDSEGLRSPTVLPGSLSRENILKELGTGLYLSNLHYLNWSDRETARLTGMTRYACFWVEDGEIVSPIEDLRFDESFYSLFGDALIDLTIFSEIIPNTGSYFARDVGGSKVPGILLSDFKFTL